VEQGAYRGAFAGLAEPGGDRTILPVAWHGVDGSFLARLRLDWRDDTELGRGPAGTSLRTGQPVVAGDVREAPALVPFLDRLERLGVGSLAAFPLLRGEERMGVLVLLAPEAGAFIPPVVALLKQLADDLAIGLAALRTRAALVEERNTLQAILDDINDPIGVMDREGRLVRVNGPFAAQAGRRPEELLGQRLSGDFIPPEELAAVQASLEKAWRGEGPVVNVNHHVSRDGTRRLVEWTNTVVRGADGAPRFLVGLGHDVTERTQAEARLRESREQLRALAGRLQTVREEEKSRIARDLHDELGQLLTGLKMDLRWLENRLGDGPSAGAGVLDRVVAASELVDQTVASVQRIATELRPGALDRLGLIPALRQEARRFQQRTGIACDTALDEGAPEPSAEVATALYRICQEAMTNVSRHAGAARVLLRLRAEPGALVLRVEDDGVGLGPAALGPEALGLLGMTERATALGGTVRFAERDGGGTAVEARIPAPPAAPHTGGAP
jgi:PAS domain S-box-containing protein